MRITLNVINKCDPITLIGSSFRSRARIRLMANIKYAPINTLTSIAKFNGRNNTGMIKIIEKMNFASKVKIVDFQISSCER